MYTLNLSTGQVTRDSDGVIVAPTSSVEDSNFVEYKDWVNSGNEPNIIQQSVLKNVITAYEFRDSFTPDELTTILNAAYAGDSICRLLLLKIQTATGGVDLHSEDTINGLAYLQSINILSGARVQEIRRL